MEAELRSYTEREAELQQALMQGGDAVRIGYALKATKRLRDDYLATRLIDFLASENWLPSYAFPQDVVKLRVVEPQYVDRFKLERDAEYGIAEYAPGSEVVADGKLIRSSAIDFRGRQPDVRHYRICRRCHNVMVDFVPPGPASCPICGAQATGAASRAKPFLVPPGFSTSLEEKVQEVRLSRVRPPRTSEVFLVSGAAAAQFNEHDTLKGVWTGYRSDGELFRANAGHDLRGFRVCLKCGSLVTGRGAGHRNRFGIPCGGRVEIVHLAYRFKTDTLQIRFNGVQPLPPPINNLGFWLSLQTAVLAAAADVLNIPSRDLDGTFRAQDTQGDRGELVLYDRVPGGAGYVQRIASDLVPILRKALDRVRSCRNPLCDPEASCYACLRSYYNQYYWNSLKRSVVVDWLGQVLGW